MELEVPIEYIAMKISAVLINIVIFCKFVDKNSLYTIQIIVTGDLFQPDSAMVSCSQWNQS